MGFTDLLRLLTPSRPVCAMMLVLLCCGSAVSLASPWIAGLLAGHLLGEVDPGLSTLGAIIAVWFALMLAGSLLGFCTAYLSGTAGEAVLARLRERVYAHIQQLPVQYYREQSKGEVLALLGKDAEIVGGFVTNTLVNLLPQLLTFFGALALMAWLSPLIALVTLLLMPLYYLALKLVTRQLRPLATRWMGAWSRMLALVEENLGLLPAIKAYTREELEAAQFGARVQTYLELSHKQILIQSLLGPAVSLASGVGLLLLLWLGSLELDRGNLSAAELVSLILYAMLISKPLSAMANVYGRALQSWGASQRLLAFFAEAPEPPSAHLPDLPIVNGDIRFDKICFAYPGRPPVFEEFTLQIAAGETVALTGPNGAGKSTLVHLLLRFADVDAGAISIDGQDIRAVNSHSLRSQIGLVAQHTLLLNGTVSDNIAYARAQAGSEDIRRAARAARAHEFIEALPQGYDTVIGDEGLKLSGGQRQRLALARALLKDPPILVLDEATSMFDPQGEAGFIAESRELLASRTVILITHRPASLALADRVIKIGSDRPAPVRIRPADAVGRARRGRRRQ